jgi:hypothetical protein
METLVIDNKLYRFNNEYDNTDDLTRRGQLKAIVNKLKNSNSNNIEKFNQILNNIQTVQSKKPYHRLNLFQKEQIVKDYVYRNWGDDKVEAYTKQIMKFIEKKEIVTQNIVYDIDTGELKSIKNIDMKDDKIVLKEKKSKIKITKDAKDAKETEEDTEKEEKKETKTKPKSKSALVKTPTKSKK